LLKLNLNPEREFMSTPAAHLEPFIKNWNRTHKQSVRLLRVAPDDKFGWRTCETAMTLGELMNHLWLAERALVEAALTGEIPEQKPEPKTNTEELIAAFDQSHAELVARLAALTPQQLSEEITPFGGKYGTMTRDSLLQAMREHEIHHRGQLYVYLRMLGADVPPLH
jgi:uncharacterized damage-inducible protein DinB